MGDMKRVQLILEAWQQTWLAEEAKRQSVSMSALLRQMMTEAIELRRAGSLADDPLWGAIGLGVGPQDGVTSENLDDFVHLVVIFARYCKGWLSVWLFKRPAPL